MAKKRKSRKGKRRGRKGGKRKGKASPKANYSLMLHGGAVIGGYKVATADLNGMSILDRLKGSIKDPAQRKALTNAVTGGQGVDIVLANTRVAQAGVVTELMRHWKPTKPLVSMADKTVRRVLGKKFRA